MSNILDMLKAIFFIGIGGALGSIFRYLVYLGLNRISYINYPLGTFSANILGCFLIGFFYGMTIKNWQISPEMKLFLTTGFCGGFTTFSTFSYEGLNLWQNSNTISFILYVGTSVVLGMMAVLAGLWLSKISL